MSEQSNAPAEEDDDRRDRLARAVLDLVKKCGDDRERAFSDLMMNADLYGEMMGILFNDICEKGRWCSITKKDREAILIAEVFRRLTPEELRRLTTEELLRRLTPVLTSGTLIG